MVFLDAFTRVDNLLGGTAADRFTLQANGRLTGSIDGGAGFNTVQGPDANAAWVAFDRALNQLDRVVFGGAPSAIGAVGRG